MPPQERRTNADPTDAREAQRHEALRPGPGLGAPTRLERVRSAELRGTPLAPRRQRVELSGAAQAQKTLGCGQAALPGLPRGCRLQTSQEPRPAAGAEPRELRLDPEPAQPADHGAD